MKIANALEVINVATDVLNKANLAQAFNQLNIEDRLVSLDESGDFNHKDLMAVTIDEVGLGLAMVIDDNLFTIREGVNDDLEILCDSGTYDDAVRRALEDGITSAIAHGKAATTSELNAAFTAVFNHLPKGDWNHEWHNGTGWMNDLTT